MTRRGSGVRIPHRPPRKRAVLGVDWTTYELRHAFVSLVADLLDDLVKVADLAGHVDTRTTQGDRRPVRPSLPHARLLEVIVDARERYAWTFSDQQATTTK